MHHPHVRSHLLLSLSLICHQTGTTGVRLSKELMAVAGEALKVNVTTLGPLVLPVSEQLLFLVNLVLRKVLKRKVRPYIPDFKMAFNKVCIHAGGCGKGRWSVCVYVDMLVVSMPYMAIIHVSTNEVFVSWLISVAGRDH